MQFDDPYDHYFCIEGASAGGYADVLLRIARGSVSSSLRTWLSSELAASKIEGAELLSIKDVTEEAREIPVYRVRAICDRTQDANALKQFIGQSATRWAARKGLLIETKVPVRLRVR